MRLLQLLLVCIAAATKTATAFMSPGAWTMPRLAISTSTSTTLYYRDDVPPIGPTPHWETPNDFQQFLTQCSIQSFLFLLKSLRDDHTVQWLHDFTNPVMLLHPNANATTSTSTGAATTTTGVPTKAKVSLAHAAQAALDNTHKDLTKGEATTMEPTEQKHDKPVMTDNKTIQKGIGKVAKAAKKKTRLQKSKPSSSSAAANTTMESSSTIPPPLAAIKLLHDKASIKTAFSHYTVGRYLAMARKNQVPVSNTDIMELYSTGIPPKQKQRPNSSVKKSFSPLAGKKFVQPTPFTGFAGGLKQQHNNKKQPTTDAASLSSSTASLYPPPKKADKTKPTVAAQEQEPQQETSSVTYKTFSSSSPIALKYHGLAILNRTRFPTWESYFEQLLDQPKESFLVESYHAHVPSYEMDIDPPSLVRRMLSVRMQIAQEFEHDLKVIAGMGGLTLKSYQEMLRGIREQRAETELQKQKDQLEKQMPKTLEDAISQRNGAAATEDADKSNSDIPSEPSVQRANLIFLDSAVGTQSDYAPSPLRKGNFDLLCLLATQEAVHRVLNDSSRKSPRSPERGSHQFLQDFYVTRILSHFSGDQPWGRSDDFLEELLFCSPRVITIYGEDKKKGEQEDELSKDVTYLVDPVKVAETILNQREKVALEWAAELTKQVQEDHMSLQRLILTKLMGGTIDECQIVDPEGQDIKNELGSCFE